MAKGSEFEDSAIEIWGSDDDQSGEPLLALAAFRMEATEPMRSHPSTGCNMLPICA